MIITCVPYQLKFGMKKAVKVLVKMTLTSFCEVAIAVSCEKAGGGAKQCDNELAFSMHQPKSKQEDTNLMIFS